MVKMKISFLYQDGDKFRNIKRKIIGIYVWEKDQWELYARNLLKKQIDNKTQTVPIGYCKQKGDGPIFRHSQIFTPKDYDFIKSINEVLMWDFKPSLAVGNIESMDKNGVARFKELLALVDE